MFDYLIHKRKFVIKLGQFISHQVISTFNDRKRIYRTEFELNELDRYNLAELFLESVGNGILEGSIPMEDVREEIAMHIDKMIPKAYVKYRDGLDIPPSQVPDDVILDTKLIYHFRENRGY